MSKVTKEQIEREGAVFKFPDEKPRNFDRSNKGSQGNKYSKNVCSTKDLLGEKITNTPPKYGEKEKQKTIEVVKKLVEKTFDDAKEEIKDLEEGKYSEEFHEVMETKEITPSILAFIHIFYAVVKNMAWSIDNPDKKEIYTFIQEHVNFYMKSYLKSNAKMQKSKIGKIALDRYKKKLKDTENGTDVRQEG